MMKLTLVLLLAFMFSMSLKAQDAMDLFNQAALQYK